MPNIRGKDADCFHPAGNHFGMLGGQLRPVLPVYLVSVIFFRVVARGHVDARHGMKVPDGKGKLGGGAQGVEQKSRDAVCRDHGGRFFGKFLRMVSGV